MSIIRFMVLRSNSSSIASSAQRRVKQLCLRTLIVTVLSVLSLNEASAAGRAGRTQGAKSSTKAATSPSPGDSSDGRGGPKNTIVFIEGGLRSDLGTFTETVKVGRLEDKQTMDVKYLGPIFQFGFLTKIFGDFRAGAALGYGLNANLTERGTKAQRNDPNFQPEQLRFGQLFTGELRLEFSKHLGDRFWLLVTPRFGISMIQVGEDLREETERLEASHFVRKPRLGFILGGDLGARYQINEWFGTRASFGLAYAGQSYLKATRRGDADDSDRSWYASTSRMTWGLAAEASF